MPARILIVDSDRALSDSLSRYFEVERFLVRASANAEDAALAIEEECPDIILLSWLLDGTSGIEFCRLLRLGKRTATLPIIMLASRNGEEARIRGLTTGADDFVVKPVSPEELSARIHALLRRANPNILAEVFAGHGIELNRSTHRVRKSGEEIRLGPTEFRLLEFLMGNPGRVYSRARLLDEVWGNDIYVDERTVDVHIGRLRRAIGTRHADPIRTVRGVGYAFRET
jgi:two-component system phosphate regulon response regulator PhoB